MLRRKLSRAKNLYKKGGTALLFGKIRQGMFGKGRLIDTAQLRPAMRNAIDVLVEKNGNSDIGDYLEFGVSQGTSMQIMFNEVTRAKLDKVRMFGFDSFEGMPEETNTDDNGAWAAGDFSQDIDSVKARLTGAGINWERVHLEKGWFENTCTDSFKQEHKVSKVGVIMIDCDIYTSTKTALEFCVSLIDQHAVMIFDDWHSGDDLAGQNLGERKAFEEFLVNYPEFEAERIGGYSFYGHPNGVLFYVNRKPPVQH